MSEFINCNTDFNKYRTKYFKIPIELMESKKVKPIDKLIYAMIRNRLNLSIKHHTYDDKGFYVYYTQQALADEVGVTKKTVNEAFKRLTGAKLLYCETEGTANRIYLYEYEVEPKHLAPVKQITQPTPVENKPVETIPVIPVIKSPVMEENFFDNLPPMSFYTDFIGVETTPTGYSNEVETTPIQNACGIETTPMNDFNGVEKLSNGVDLECNGVEKYGVGVETTPNNIINKTYNKPMYNSINHSNLPSITQTELEGLRRMYIKQLDMHYLEQRFNYKPIVGEVLDIIIDMHLDKFTVINGQEKSVEVIRSVLSKLTSCHIEDVINTYNEQYTQVKFPHAYLKTLIYNTGLTLSAKTDNRVNADSANAVANGGKIEINATRGLLDELLGQNALMY